MEIVKAEGTPLMFDRILIPLDGSELAETAVLRTLPLAKRLAADVIVAQVLNPRMPAGLSTPYASPSILQAAIDRQQQAAEQYLHAVVDKIADSGVLGGWIVLEGDPALRLFEYARQESIGLIAMTTHGRSGLARLAMGSVAERIVHDAPFPVLLYRAGAESESNALGVLAALDGTRESERILPAATLLARELAEPLILLRAVSVPEAPRVVDGTTVAYVDEMMAIERTEAERYLASLAAGIEHQGVAVQVIVRTGPISDAICQEAADRNCRVIAMATHSLTGVARLTHGSVADDVLRHTGRPVLLLRMTAPAGGGDARTAGDIMTTNLFTVTPDAPIEEALWLIVSKRVSGIPVVDEQRRLVGIVTEYDMLLSQAIGEAVERSGADASPGLGTLAADLAGRPVVAFMSTAVEAVEESTPLDEVARRLLSKDVKRVPVVREGELVGIVSRSDLMRALATKLGVVETTPDR